MHENEVTKTYYVARGWRDGESMQTQVMYESNTFDAVVHYQSSHGGYIVRLMDHAFFMDGAWHNDKPASVIN